MLRNLLTLAQTISKNTLDMVHSLDDVVVFLNRDEIEPAKVEEENHYMADECAIAASISNGTFTWGTERMSPKVLSNINIQIPKGHLTLIIGKPAAGKSSLLSALLSEMNCIVGEVCWSGDKDIAYAAQYPAIFGGTVQDNVLFGMDYDAERYLKIITLCNLVDHTININESKTNSLHQISLARALYSSANTVILDDPLAGLNPESRDQFFFESVVLFAGEEKRTVVMTTTDPELLEHAYQVILLDEGRIVYQGKPDNDTLREHPIIAELTIANVRSLPPPVPHRRRFDNKSVETNEVHVKNVPSTAYKEWIQSSSGLNLAFALISLSCMVFLNATVYWLLLGWITHSSTVARVTTVTMSPNVVTKAPRPGYNFSAAVSDKGSPFPFLCAGGGVVVLQLLTVLLVNSVVHSASNTLLKDMLHSVCSVCLYAYNKTPVSAVLNRFTVDLELIGRPLMECLGAVLFLTSETLATIIVQVIVSPGSLVVLVPLTVCLVWMFLLYSPTSRVLRILQTEFKQNIYKHISETVSCLTLVRGYNVTDRYRTRLQTHSTKLYHINMVISGTSRWLSLYQDLTVNLITFGCFVATCLVSEQGRTEMSALSFLLILLSTQQLRLIWNYLESCDIILSSIDNCTNYAYHIPRETETPRFKPPKDWPQFGAISIKDVFASLSPDQEPILRNINLEIPAGTKLGVSSVQGGGKEFIVPLLFRSLYINNGNVKIDEWDTSSLSLEDLRAHISFISSDPPIYTGSIRYNIDPEVKQEDHEIWKVLEKVYLQEKIADLPKNLDSDDFAMNRQERQLLNLAKVLLNPSSIIVVEESKFITNVDLFTKFYEVLDRELGTRTRIIIGRRSVTLETCDKLLFLDQGRLVSFGDKDDLERDNCSYYRQLNRASARVSRLPSES